MREKENNSQPKIVCVTDESSRDEGKAYSEKGFLPCCPSEKTCPPVKFLKEKP